MVEVEQRIVHTQLVVAAGLTVRPYLNHVAVEYVRLPLGNKFFIHLLNHPRCSKVVARVENHHIFALSHADAFVHGIVYAVVPFRDPANKTLVGKAFDNVDTLIGAGSVHHNIFYVVAGLFHHALHGFLQPLGVVSVDGDDR